ncbi:MAG: hypothetical protein A2268_14500 [Candidatus Raymondbacteria bacterium RifOxyA12_full_50_37]|uniref:UPF0033 domain-containing protein n=1 Tax=Candidatus Raymondbacteria bacterium RIFOXYD12_FULL_49_13 TaxID=1817890 RepID=A0A1F7F2L6_UNCRA|nr:MAG: hypothetical protein A2268_14500 [Candidatus Raymondbacteria bacterium RifOxyA12_full_50_37]OGJ88711.1 MAG: hypothetical protein A2248_20435 [Candidatus Raymondbacteria bacterium RIFOXYA2_FULL_49_16]OGJ90519.1 MAG: hypothetical protein A2350_18715 [Candidatus Raymondbacteria bacterium RifOxyB12_full_50_8]OGK00881.1 MAG: hypothetical protein A2519_07690 [Candidatus Raymondbacteria bacterium RIFOXYD12_FULL_49_13]OGK02912.1 MAG: hypothetical protein A2487_17875 [Candidatus Raymondbacteria 
MKTVDARGLLCPKPLILTKKEFSGLTPGEELTILIDNETSKSNVERFLTDNGAAVTVTSENGLFTLKAVKKTLALAHPDAESYCTAIQPANPHVICIKADTMGHGEEDLGRILIKAFINTIKEASPLPGSIVFYNKGIFLALTDSPVINALVDLQEKKVKILVCGTCLDYYGKKAELGAGIVSNMYDITQSLTSAGHIVCP